MLFSQDTVFLMNLEDYLQRSGANLQSKIAPS